MKKFDLSLSICRICGMFFIILCHYLPKLTGISALGQLFNVGVQMFLILSGVLYGRKMGGVDHTVCNMIFYIKNLCKLCIPIYIWLIVVSYLHLVNRDFYIFKSVPVYLLNIQGLNWMTDLMELPLLPEMTILWFMTVIMLCYFCLPLMNICYEKSKEKLVPVTFVFALAIVLLGLLHVYLGYIFIFYIGFVFGRENYSMKNEKNFIALFLITLFIQSGRLILRKFIDGTYWYDKVYVEISHTVLAIFIILAVCYLYRKFVDECKLEQNLKDKIIYLDRLSVYIYIVHYAFLNGIFAADRISDNQGIWTIVFFTMTAISSLILKVTSEKTINIILSSRNSNCGVKLSAK